MNDYRNTRSLLKIVNLINGLEKPGVNLPVADDLLTETIVDTDGTDLPIDKLLKDLLSAKKYKEITEKINKKMLIKKLHSQT